MVVRSFGGVYVRGFARLSPPATARFRRSRAVARCSSHEQVPYRTGSVLFASKRVASTAGSTYKKRAMSLRLMLRACLLITLLLACPIFSRLWITPVSAQARKELRVGVAGVPTTLDPAGAIDGAVPLIARQVFDTLVAFREGSTDIEPALATRWAVSKDGLTWTFWLREGVKFADGAPLTAGEVAASFSRGLKADPAAPPAAWAALLRGVPGVIKDVRASDARTVQIVLVQPYAPRRADHALSAPGLRVGYLAFQTEKEPFTRKPLRQAVAAALDPAVLAVTLGRAAVPLQSFLPPGVWARREGGPVLGGTRAQVRSLLLQGNWPKGATAAMLAS